MSTKKPRYGYTFIAPIPGIEDLIQKYRLQYNYFMKMRGIPSHVTIFYPISEKNYLKNKELIHYLFRLLPNILKNKKMTIEKVEFEKSMVSLQFDKKTEAYLLKIQEIISEKCGLSNNNKRIMRPHITLFTDRIPNNFRRGLEDKDQILKEIGSKLPITIQLHKLWFVKFNKDVSNSRVLEEIRF
jgi:hypothetical protein